MSSKNTASASIAGAALNSTTVVVSSPSLSPLLDDVDMVVSQ